MAELILKSSYDEDIKKCKDIALNLSEQLIQARRYNVRDKKVIDTLSKALHEEKAKGKNMGKIVACGGNTDEVMHKVMKELKFTQEEIDKIDEEAKLLIKKLGH